MRLRQLINRRRNQKSTSTNIFGRRWSDKYSTYLGENRFTELINASSQGFLIHNFDFTPLFVNSSFAKILGYSVPEMGRIDNLKYLYATGEIPRLKSYVKNCKFRKSHVGPPTIYEIEAIHKCGRKIILQQSIQLIDWQGTQAILLTASDITEKHIAQQALELNEQRFRDFAESASDWCWEIDSQLRFTFISDSFERITGCKKEDIIGKTRFEFVSQHMPQKLVTEDDIANWKEHHQTLLRREAFTDFVYRWYKSDDSIITMRTNGKPIFNNDGEFVGYRGAANNITAELELTEKLNYKATHDDLTGLINRGHFDNELHKVIDEVHIHGNSHVLAFMDLDRFKIVNDTCGHLAGDQLLQQLALLLRESFYEGDTIARLGGDEFAVIMRECSVEQCLDKTQRLHKEMEKFRFIWNSRTFSIGASIGVVEINRDSDGVSSLLRNADSACYMAKNTGRNKTHVFSENDADIAKRQREIRCAARITEALEEGAFTLYAQAICPLQTPETMCYELMIRLKEDSGLVAPEAFLSAAERYDLSLVIDQWVLRKALDWMNSHRSILSSAQLIFINLSGKTIGQKKFSDYALRLMKDNQIPPDKICFEITETAAVTNLAEAISFIKQLRKIGCYFALDDFGSGVSSYAYLKNLPVDFLKIDGMFIRDMCSDPVNMAMVKSINEISHVMGKKTIAEFVEDDQTVGVLRDMGLDYAQGFAIHKPAPLDDLRCEGEIRRYLRT